MTARRFLLAASLASGLSGGAARAGSFDAAGDYRFSSHAVVSEGFAEAPAPDYATDLMSSSEGLALAKAFMRIPNVRVRRRIVDLVEEMADDGKDKAV